MGLLPSIFGGSSDSNKSKKPKRSSYTPSTVDKKSSRSSNSEMSRLLSGKGIDMTDSDVKLSTSKSPNNLNVARSNILDKISQGVAKTEREKNKISSQLPREERQRLGRELQAAEDSSADIVRADISQEEKILVSAEVLVEASDLIKKRIDELFELKVSLGDRNEDEIREEMKQLRGEVYSLVDQNMPAYDYIHNNAAGESGAKQIYVVNAANLFRNTVKVFSALSMDSGREIQQKKRWEFKNVDFKSGSDTVFNEFFA